MIQLKRKAISLILAVMLIVTNCPIVSQVAQAAESSIIIHYYSEIQNPYVYYWNSLPENIVTDYPGVAMTADAQQGDNWYSYTFEGCTKINMLFTNSDGSQVTGKEFTRYTGEWWCKNSRWYSYHPDQENPSQVGTDFREETIYNLIITRFYDGDSDNNVHCWDDAQAGNPDSDPAWRGDFKGLEEKLNYIKALGFSTVSLTPVAQNASGYDYHGWHTINFKEIDSRYESDGYTYEDLVKACHDRGMKVMQEVTLSTGNFGESNLCPIFEVDEDADASNIEERMVPTASLLGSASLSSARDYWEQDPSIQYQQRLNVIKNTDYSDNSNSTGSLPDVKDYDIGKLSDSSLFNPLNRYHSGYFQLVNSDDWTSQFCQLADDMVDLNTENPYVGQYLAEAMKMYADAGVDAVYINSADKITSLSLEVNIIKPLKEMLEKENLSMEIFGQIDSRSTDVWYSDQPILSAPFYTWSKADDELTSQWRMDETAEAINNNMNLAFDFIKANNDVASQPTSNNAFLDGITYRTTDYTEKFMNVQDSPMMYNFATAQSAFQTALAGDQYYNDATWNMTMYQNYDYTHGGDPIRSGPGTNDKAEKLSLMFTFRGIPTLLYGDEVEFMSRRRMDAGSKEALGETGRAYFGDYLEGDVTATDFSEYTASGTVADTLATPLAKHIQKLNAIRRAIPALQKGQYTSDKNYVEGNLAFIRRFTNAEEGVDSLALVTVSNSATFKNIPNGTYIDAVTGDVKSVTNGTLSVSSLYKGNMRVYVCCASGFTGIDGAIGNTSDYLKSARNTGTSSDTTASTYTTETMVWSTYDPSPLVVSAIDTDFASPQYKGTDIVITATGKTESNTEISYRFSVDDVVIQDFSADNTCCWIPDSIGTSTITVDVKDEAGNTNTRSIDYLIEDDSEVVKPILKGVSLRTGSNIIKGESADITIKAGGGNTGTKLLFYKYIIKDPDGNKINTPYYSLDNTFSITPEALGEYTVNVYVQGSDNSTVRRTFKYTSFLLADDITEANVNVTAPVKGGTPANATTADNRYIVTNTVWEPADSSFAPDTVYRVIVTLEAKEGYQFTNSTTFRINDSTATVVACSAGEAKISFTFPATDGDDEHTHSYGTDWKSDATNHWHACACGEKKDKAVHTYDAGKITKDPTDTTEGIKTFTCTVCGATKTETIPATGPSTPTDPSIPATGPSTPTDPSIPTVGTKLKDSDDKAVYKLTSADKTNLTVEFVAPVNKKEKSITIPETIKVDGITYMVTSIARNAYKNNRNITKITIGSNIKTIGANAFSGCKKLTKVTIGKNVTTIGEKAFYKCTALTKITIPSKVSKIGKQAFYGCKNLKTITIKTTKLTSKNVGSKAFKGIYSKAKIKVPKSKLTGYKKLLKSKGVSSKAEIKK